MAQILFPWQYVPSTSSGRPVALGSMYFGDPDTDPEIPLNQIQVRAKQEDGSLVNIPQPVMLNAGGVPTYQGSPIILDIVEEEFSMKVLDSGGAEVYYNENNIPYAWGTNQIADGAVTTIKIADEAVTTPKIADEAVTGAKLFPAVAGKGIIQDVSGNLDVNPDDTSIEIDPAAAPNDKVRIKDLGVSTAKIADLAVTTIKIADDAVTNAKIGDNAVDTLQIAGEAITSSKMKQPTAGNTYELARFVAAGSSQFATSGTSAPSADIRFSGGAEPVQNRRIGFMVIISGVIRVKYTQSAAVTDCYSRIYKNGSTEYSNTVTAGNSENTSEDITVSKGDVVQIVHWADAGLGTSILDDVRITSNENVSAIG